LNKKINNSKIRGALPMIEALPLDFLLRTLAILLSCGNIARVNSRDNKELVGKILDATLR
jgi:hypothetical protein